MQLTLGYTFFCSLVGLPASESWPEIGEDWIWFVCIRMLVNEVGRTEFHLRCEHLNGNWLWYSLTLILVRVSVSVWIFNLLWGWANYTMVLRSYFCIVKSRRFIFWKCCSCIILLFTKSFVSLPKNVLNKKRLSSRNDSHVSKLDLYTIFNVVPVPVVTIITRNTMTGSLCLLILKNQSLEQSKVYLSE